MCSSTIFLHLIQNHIVSDFDNISCSVLDFLLNSCNEPMAKKIVEEVIAGEGKNLQTEHNAWKRQPKIETITTVIDDHPWFITFLIHFTFYITNFLLIVFHNLFTSLLNFEVYDFMCSSTIFLHLIQNHIVSDFDNISCSVFDF
jgi:hypothetical protein